MKAFSGNHISIDPGHCDSIVLVIHVFATWRRDHDAIQNDDFGRSLRASDFIDTQDSELPLQRDSIAA